MQAFASLGSWRYVELSEMGEKANHRYELEVGRVQWRRGHDYAINNVCCEGETGGETSGRKKEQGGHSTADKEREGGGGREEDRREKLKSKK